MASGVHGSRLVIWQKRRGVGVQRDLVAARPDDLARDVRGAVAGEECHDGGHTLRRGHGLALPVLGQALRHARVGGGEMQFTVTPYFAMPSAAERVRPTMPSFAAE